MGKKRDKYNDAGPSTQNVLTKSVKISKEHIDKITLFQMEDDAQTLAFPSTLSSAERKSIHQYAIRVGLKSKSIGKGMEYVSGCVADWRRCTFLISVVFVVVHLFCGL